MRLWVLAGMLPFEKRQLALEFAQYWAQQGQPFTIFDHGNAFPAEGGIRLRGALLPQLGRYLHDLQPAMALLIVSEQLAPAAVFAVLDELQSALPALEIRTLALLDERTEACFPQVGQSWEQIADAVITYPYSLTEILARWR